MNRHDVMVLQQMNGYPSLTITLPTHRTSPDNRQDPIRVKNLVSQASDRLLGEFSKREVEPLLTRLDHLTDGIDYRYTLDGLAMFVTRDFAAAYNLPFTLKENVVVDDTFFTRDLVFAMNRTPRYWTLALSEQPTRLYEGAREDMIEIHGGGFPMLFEGQGGEQLKPGGFGGPDSGLRDIKKSQFFREIDQALKPFMVDDSLPLAVVGVDRNLSFFREVTGFNSEVIATLRGSHDSTSPHELHKLVWPLVEAALAERREQAFVALDRAVGEQKVVSSMDAVWRMAQDGRGELLLVEEDFHFPATVDESGQYLTAAEDATAPGVIDDAVDDIIEATLAKGGRVVFVDNGRLADYQRIALTLRY